MSRGQLEKTDWQRINGLLPDLNYIRNTVDNFTPEILSLLFHPNSYIPVASVCFKDVLTTCSEAIYAISESSACKIWYLEKCNPPKELEVVFFRKYYLDDAALRLYSAGEQLADGITLMLEIDKTKLKAKVISKQIKLGHYLKADMPEHPITGLVNELAGSQSWLKTLKYRGDWVHEQPPSVKGFGIVYERKKRWKTAPSGSGITMNGFGDTPKISVDELEAFILPSAIIFYKVFLGIIKYYLELLKSNGFTVTDTNDISTIGIKFNEIDRPKWLDDTTIKLE